MRGRVYRLCANLQAVSPGEVVTEFRPRFEQQKDPKSSIGSVYKEFDFEVSLCQLLLLV